MKGSFFVLPLLSLVSLASFAFADTLCNADSSCPQDKPCCSQFGVCGSGSYCLGGCDVRFSYNLTACMPMPIMDSFTTTFDNTSDSVLNQYGFLGNASETDWVYSGNLDTHEGAALLQMPKNSGGTIISSTKYLWYGKVSATLKTSHDGGVVTAFILFSNVQDEIDFEFVGYNLTQAQNNFYSLGKLDYKNSENSSLSDTFANYHTYTIDWKEDQIEWSVDGQSVRVLKKTDKWNATEKRFDYPQTPTRIQFSLWPGGNATNAPGTIAWAGGPINWDSQDIQKNGYYYASVQNVTVEAYNYPKNLTKIGPSSDGDYNSFLYNSTAGNSDSVVLTNRKQWLGSMEDSGLDPHNDKSSSSSSSKSSTKSSSSSKSSGTNTSTGKSTATTTNTQVGNPGAAGMAPQNDGGDQNTDADTTTVPPSTQTGFIQDSSAPATSSGSSQISSKNEASGVVSIFGAILVGLASFLM